MLGFTFRDTITGFQGVAIGHCEYLTGCHQTLLQPPAGVDSSKRPDSEWFDDQRLAMVTGIPAVVLDNGTTPGADREAPKC